MDATVLGPVGKGRGSWRRWTGRLMALALTGLVFVGCTDNNGRVTPTNAKLSGDGLGGPSPGNSLFVQVTVNPGTIDIGRRASVLVIVTSANGIGIPGKAVQLTATGGILDASSGVTGDGGLFSTTMVVPCGTVGAGQVVAIVEGVVSLPASFTGVTPAENNPCPVVGP